MFELANLRVVPAPAQVDDVRYAEGAEFIGMVPGSNRATERQSLTDEIDPQREPLSIPGLAV